MQNRRASGNPYTLAVAAILAVVAFIVVQFIFHSTTGGDANSSGTTSKVGQLATATPMLQAVAPTALPVLTTVLTPEASPSPGATNIPVPSPVRTPTVPQPLSGGAAATAPPAAVAPAAAVAPTQASLLAPTASPTLVDTVGG